MYLHGWQCSEIKLYVPHRRLTEKLIERLSTADIKQVKEDVLPFVRNPKELDIWSNDYFVQLAGMMIMG